MFFRNINLIRRYCFFSKLVSQQDRISYKVGVFGSSFTKANNNRFNRFKTNGLENGYCLKTDEETEQIIGNSESENLKAIGKTQPKKKFDHS